MLNINVFFPINIFCINEYSVNTLFLISNCNRIVFYKVNGIGSFVFISIFLRNCRTILRNNGFDYKSFRSRIICFCCVCAMSYCNYKVLSRIYTNLIRYIKRRIKAAIFFGDCTRCTTIRNYFLYADQVILLIHHR